MILAIDIGGTEVKLGLVDRAGTIHARHRARVDFDGYETPILTTVLKEARAFVDRENAEIEGVGASVAGQIDTETGVIIGTNGRIPNYEGSRVKEALEAEFAVPAAALNDANAAALGECFIGRGRGMENVLMVTLGTGVGGGIVLDGKIFGGARGIAGELGHFTLYQDGERCTCGKNGCYECYASASALVRRAERETGETGLDGRIIFDRAQAGDPAMQRVLGAWIDDIAAGITGLVHIFNPEIVLIGGGVSAREALLIEPLRRKVLFGAMPRFGENLILQRAALANDAGLVGAARFFMDRNQIKKESDAK